MTQSMSRKRKLRQVKLALESEAEGEESTGEDYTTTTTTMPRPRKRRPPLTVGRLLLSKLARLSGCQATNKQNSSCLLFLILVLNLTMTPMSILVLCKPNNNNQNLNQHSNHIDRTHHHHHNQHLQLTDKQLLRKAFEASGGDSARSSPATSGGAIQSEQQQVASRRESSSPTPVATNNNMNENDRGQTSGSVGPGGAGGFQCPEQFGYYTDAKDCTKYYVCVFGEVLHESCTGGLRFSRELQTCDWPRNVDCPQGSGSSNQTSTTTTTTTTTISENSSTSSTQAPPSTTTSSSTMASSTTQASTTTTPASVTSTPTSAQDNRMKGNQNSLVFADESSDPQQPSFDEAISPVITADGAIHLHDGSGGTFALGPNHNRGLVASSPQSFNGPLEAGSLSGAGSGGAQSGASQDVDVFVMPLTIAQQQQQRASANQQRARFSQQQQQQPTAARLSDKQRQQQQQQGRPQLQNDNSDSAREASELSDESGDFQLGPAGEQEGGSAGPNSSVGGGEMLGTDVGTSPLNSQADQEGEPGSDAGPLLSDAPGNGGVPLSSSVTESSIGGGDQPPDQADGPNDYVDDSSAQPPPAAGYIPPVPLSENDDGGRQFAPGPARSQQPAGGRQSSALLSINNRQIVDPTRQTFKPVVASTPPSVSTSNNNQQQSPRAGPSQLISSSRDRQQQATQSQQQNARNFQQQQQQTTANVNNRQNNQQQLQSLQSFNAQNNRQSRMSAGFNSGGVSSDSSPAPQNPLSFAPTTTTAATALRASADSRQQQLMSSNVNFNDSSKLVRVGPGQTGGGNQLTPTFSSRPQPSARSQQNGGGGQLLRPTMNLEDNNNNNNNPQQFSHQLGQTQFNNTNKLFINDRQQPARPSRVQDPQFSNQQFPLAQQQQQQQQQRRPRPPKRHQIPSGGNDGVRAGREQAQLPTTTTTTTSRRQNVLLDFEPGTTSTMSTPIASRQPNRSSNLLLVDLKNNNNENSDQPFSGRDNNLSGQVGSEASNFQPQQPPATPTRSNSFRPAAINLRDSVGTATTHLPPGTASFAPAARQRFNISPNSQPPPTTTTTTAASSTGDGQQTPIIASSTMSSLGGDAAAGPQPDPQAVANRYLSSAIDALEAGQPFGAVDYDFDILSDNSTDRRPSNGTQPTPDYVEPQPNAPAQPVASPSPPVVVPPQLPKQTPAAAAAAVPAGPLPPANKRQSAAVTAAASIPLNDGQIVNMSDSIQGDGPSGVGRSRATNTNRGGPATTTSTSTTTTAATNSATSGTPTRKPRPTNKKIVVNHEQALANIRASIEPAKRPEPLYATPVAAQPAAKCDTRVCRLPDCKCGDTLTPAGMDAKVIPQVVLLTFDDAVNDLNWEIYEELFTGRTNPNGCPVLATFYVSHEWTDYGQVQTLYSRGHEMASHSVTHSFGEKFSKGQWFKEINGQREILNMYGGVKMNDVRGMRAPFLQIGGNKMFEMLYDANFTYDSSMPIFENSPPMWPYTLDYQLAHECMITPCPTKSYPGVWEVGMTMWVDLRGGRCSMGDACSNPTDEDGVYEMLMKNFNRHYKSNRAPFGLFYHSAWFNTVHHRRGFLKFMTTVNSLPDVFFVTNWQMLQWMRQPTPLSEINSFEPWQCPAKNDRPPPCYHPSVCNVKSEHGTRFMKTCQPCPANQQYPWVS